MTLKPAKFLLPGIFLLILGVGNVLVGGNKVAQYRSVIQDLTALGESYSGASGTTSLERIQQAKRATDRHVQLEHRARARTEFYLLVTFGGKVLVGIGIIFVMVGTLIHLIPSNVPVRET